MKLKIGDKFYLEKCALNYLFVEHSKVPMSIVQEACRDKAFIVNGPIDGRRFQAFEAPCNIRWIEKQDWIIDYDEYSKKSTDELEKILSGILEEEAVICTKLAATGKTPQQVQFTAENDELIRVTCRRNSILEIIRFRKGEIELLFPDGYTGSRN